eukprot:TRINITY_DN812_c0_g1_i3.p1 TRINITY_DN812_c0_g1~~TRINITY_DN812_c0_g1_i3.p1  ORF type:complete len:158 (-),score=49.89 TRINITY_DN812_c0_g1_i3:50-523(-)
MAQFQLLLLLVLGIFALSTSAQRYCFTTDLAPDTAVTWNVTSTDAPNGLAYMSVKSTTQASSNAVDDGRGIGWKFMRKRWHTLNIAQSGYSGAANTIYHFWFDYATSTYSRAFIIKGKSTGFGALSIAVFDPTSVQQEPGTTVLASVTLTACNYTFA